MKKLHFTFLIFLILTAIGCQKELVETNPVVLQPNFDESKYFVPDFDGVSDRSNCAWTVLDAGSVDVLADAIANTCDGGVIYLKAGEHTENERVTISKRVIIIGEDGAVLKVKSELAPYNADFTMNIYPGLHILDGAGTLIQNIKIEPVGGDGGTAILIENSDQAAVLKCKITGFQFAIVVEKSDRTAFMYNTIVATDAWLDGRVQESLSITIINGNSSYISDNDVSNTLIGIWACGSWGTCERNVTHGNYLGVMLCNVPQYLKLPDGRVTGSDVPAKGWKVNDNKSPNNFSTGYLVIDGANNNWLSNNEGGGNADYDMELTTDSYRFGFLTPGVYENTVDAGAYNITIKDCGRDNQIYGGTLIDTDSDPCN